MGLNTSIDQFDQPRELAQHRDPMSEAAESEQERIRNGLISAFLAYFLWGVLPVYFKAVEHVPTLEVLVHRIIWAVPFGALIIASRRQWPEVRAVMRHRKSFVLLSLTAVLIALNWLVYIVAVQSGQIFQASLGYYINPLFFALAGVLFFKERLSRNQGAAILIAAIGVLVLTFSGGELPTIALMLAVLFTLYGVVRKYVHVGGMPGLFIETAVLLPFALAYLTWLMRDGNAVFGQQSLSVTGLLILAGPLTALPLLFFALGARRLNLSTIGIMQFMAPTLQFFAGLYYGEVLTTAHVICFCCIWLAVLLFGWDAWKLRRMEGNR